MALVVQKFGGTSVADPDRIRAVADHIARTRRQGDDVVVVVSAMGKTTDELIRLAAEVSNTPAGREMDMLLTAGERISMALLCNAAKRTNRPMMRTKPTVPRMRDWRFRCCLAASSWAARAASRFWRWRSRFGSGMGVESKPLVPSIRR